MSGHREPITLKTRLRVIWAALLGRPVCFRINVNGGISLPDSGAVIAHCYIRNHGTSGISITHPVENCWIGYCTVNGSETAPKSFYDPES